MRPKRGVLCAALLVLGILVCGDLAAFAKDPIKIGFLAPYVGFYSKDGREMDKGFRLALEERGYKAGGREIVFIPEDTEAKAELGPTKARKLIESEKVHMIAGIINSGVALSIRDIVVNSKTPLIITNAGAVDLTGGKLKSPYIFRVSFANGQTDMAAGWYAYNKLGYRRAILLAADYGAGHEKAEGFKKYFKASGGQIVEEIYAPANTNDFGPFLTKILAQSKAIDCVWMFFAGSGSIRLINQYNEYGLKGTVPAFVIGDTVDESALPFIKDAALGIKSYLHYAEALQTPENQKFVQAYKAKYNEYPGMWAEQGYVGAKVIGMALDAIQGNIEDKEAFLAALAKVKFMAPRGPFSFDANQNAVFHVYIREVKKVAGRYENVVLETIPNVDQNWSPARMNK
jgi:branched-chain amino acid transport system substrate-binding protein